MGLRRLAISNPSATTDTILFTSDNQYLISVIATNKSISASSNIRIWVEPSGSSSSSEYAYIVYDFPVDQTNSYETFRFAINQNDVVKVRSSSTDISFQAYGLIQIDVNLGVGISSYQTTAPSNPVDGLIWVDSDGVSGTSAKPAYVYDSAAMSWIPLVGGINTTENYTFTGTIALPTTTSVGNVSSTEIGYIDGVTSSIQTQINTINANLSSIEALAMLGL